MNDTTNAVEVIGQLQNGLYLSHEKMGEKFYAGTLKVKRLSGAEDLLPVTIPGRLYEQAQAIENGPVQITGQLRTYNKVVGDKGRLFVNIHAQSIEAAQESTLNEVQLTGTICKQRSTASLPSAERFATDACRQQRLREKATTFPSSLGEATRSGQPPFTPATASQSPARIQSRDYEKKLATGDSITRTAYEVSAFKLGLEGAA